MIVLSDSGLRETFTEAASTLAHGLSADRAAVVYLDKDGQLEFGGAFGISSFSLDDAPISVSVLREVVETDRNIVYTNVAAEANARDNVSLQLSGAISLICVPFHDEKGVAVGALYADHSSRTGAFHRAELLYARDCAVWLEGCLAGRRTTARPEAPVARKPPKVQFGPPPPGTSPPSAAPREKIRRAEATEISLQRVSASGLMIFFRSLSTMVSAGIQIHEGLSLLAKSTAERSLAGVLDRLSDSVLQGQPLSSAMEVFPNVFPPHLRSAIRVGERTGRLVHVLDVLSTDLEKGQRLAYRVRSALAYPAILSVACGLVMLFGPPYLLGGHLKILQESGVALPFLTRALILLSKVAGNPLFLLTLVLGGAALSRYLLTEDGTRVVRSQALRLPVVGKMLRLVSLTGFSRSLSLQLKAGLTVLEALGHSRQSCRDAELNEALRQAEIGLRDGATLAEALGLSGYFSRSFLSFIDSGENSGTLVKLTEWLAGFYEQELEGALERFVSLAEPVLMAVMGAATALILVATIKPTLLILQTL